MGLFQKKEGAPQISSGPTLPVLPRKIEEKISELPTMPSNATNDSLNEEMIKSAVSDVIIKDESGFEEEEKKSF